MFLFSLYPALFLYLHNIREIPFVNVLPALALALTATTALWFALGLVLKSKDKRALALFLLLLLIHFYGLAFAFIRDLAAGFGVALPQAPLLATAIVLWLLATRQINKSRRSFRTANRLLTLLTFFLIAWNGGGILLFHLRAGIQTLTRQRAEAAEKKSPTKAKAIRAPDIYYVILDEFASLESVRNLFHYDNSAFARRLQQRGFVIADQSRSLYTLTEQSLAASLNMRKWSKGEDPYALVRQNQVCRYLKQRGYRIVEVPFQRNLFFAGSDRRYYYSLRRASIFFDDFYRILFERSIFRFLTDDWRRRTIDFSPYFRERILYAFDRLQKIVGLAGPKFVFIHLFSPHEPFVFGRGGQAVDPDHFFDHENPRFYLEQYEYISRRTAETVDVILRRSAKSPVIIIQSDHGYRGSLLRKGRKIRAAEIKKLFLALHLPGYPPAAIDPALSPPNIFRLVFNHYFGANLPLIDTRTPRR